MPRLANIIGIDNPAAADRQIQRVEYCVNRIRAFPMMGRKGIRTGTREFPVPETPYLLVYRIQDESLQIVALLHGARNWKAEPRTEQQ